MTDLHFKIDASEPASRTASVTLEVPRSALEVGPDSRCEFFLAAWTPGSYLLREYARHLGAATATDVGSGTELDCRKVAKNRFAVQLQPETQQVQLRYTVYAHELSVRTADFTDSHAYWNNACLLLWPSGRPELSCTLQVAMPVGWDAASSLTASDRQAGEITWQARDLDEAIDSPCLLGQFERLEFEALGVPHTVLLDGLAGVEPPTNLTADLTAIVQAAADVFDGRLPYESYQFQCLFTDDGYGGLEHRSSTTLLARRTAFASPTAYREFLALCAHELFHVWNIKRLRPAEFWSYDYERENYTTFLWLAEGWTAYYDDLLCLRAGCTTSNHFLQQVVSKSIERVLGAAGRHKLSLAESSYDAWIRLYRPDENTRNSSQNYYVNGAVAAMCLDLLIRRETSGERCLDDVLRALFQSTYEAGRGYDIGDVDAAVRDVGGDKCVGLMHAMIDGPLDPPLTGLLADFGIRLEFDKIDRPFLGVAFKPGTTRIASLQDDTPAARAGLHPNDEVLALRGLRVTSDTWRDVFDSVAHCEEPLEVLLARRGVIMTLGVTPAGNQNSVRLSVEDESSASCTTLRQDWLRMKD